MQSSDQLRSINNFEYLIHYLEEKLDWPLQEYGFDELTFEYQPAEVGLKEEEAAKVKNIHQLRPLQSGQPWGIFFVEFENKKLPVVVLRRILSHLVIKKRASANKAREAAWHAEDLMFITTFGEDDSTQREIAFAHFHQSPGDLPTLRVLGWDGSDTPLKLAHVDHQLRQHLSWPDNPADLNGWREQWRKPFRHRIGHVIRTADTLAEVLAALARGIRDRAIKMISVESSYGPLRQLHKAFQKALIHDLTEESFADTYAQTITYGLLTAAISRTEGSEGRYGTFIIAENVTDMVPITNPFLREMLQTFLKVGGRKGGIDFDELGIQDVVELLRGEETNLPAILRDFGNKTRGEDPVIHFYEHFLSAYNKKLKIKRGVFYTPQPVVSYIIRSVHELLQTEFGLEDGLASTVTWGEMIARHPEMKLPVLTPKNPAKPDSKNILISPDTPFVIILDIATGTGTFLVEVIDIVHKTMTVKWQKQGKSELESVKLWNEYVPKHLLPRLHGYELMMAPYAIAHMKIGLKLFETGYQFKSNERVRVYLTNTLEPPHDIQQQLAGILPALSHEANAVNDIKKDTFFNIIVGNPPYSHRANLLSAEQRQMINEYKSIDGHRMKVRGALQLERNLNDDYVKFLRYAQIIINKSHYGIVGMITNNAYLENLTFPGMRNSLALTYDLIKITNLNGSTKAGGLTPEGNKDENVFEIQQGVAISILAKSIHKTSNYRQYSELWGARTDKEEILKKSQLQFENFSPEPEFYLFVPLKTKDASEYWNWKSLDQIFYYFGTGVMTNRNELTIAPTNTQLQSKINIFINSKYSDKDISDSLGLKTNALWNLHKARIEIEKIDTYKFFQQIDFRPFDTQIIFYHALAVDNMRKGLMKSIVQKGNLALIVSRQQFVQGFNHAFVTNKIFDECLLSTASREKSSGFPMHVDSSEEGGLQFHDKNRNIHDSFLSSLNTYEPNGNLVLKFNYIYSILYSENYRHRYAEHLKRGYARIPESNDLQFVINLSKLGEELISLHLLGVCRTYSIVLSK